MTSTLEFNLTSWSFAPYSLYYIRLCFLNSFRIRLECFCSNTLSFLLKFIRYSHKLTDACSQMTSTLKFILLLFIAPIVYIYIRWCFLKFLCKDWMALFKYFISSAEILRFSKICGHVSHMTSVKEFSLSHVTALTGLYYIRLCFQHLLV